MPERPVRADLALVRAWQADADGNLVCRSTAHSFKPDRAISGKIGE